MAEAGGEIIIVGSGTNHGTHGGFADRLIVNGVQKPQELNGIKLEGLHPSTTQHGGGGIVSGCAPVYNGRGYGKVCVNQHMLL